MKPKITTAALGVLVLCRALTSPANAQGIPDKLKQDPARLQKTVGSPSYSILNIGGLTSWIRYDGINFSPSSDNATYYPAHLGNVIYKDGLMWGGKAFLDAAHTIPVFHTVRVGGATYGTGTRSGYVTGLGATAVAAPQSNPEVRVYRIRRDYFALKTPDGSYTDDLRQDAADINEFPSPEVTNIQMDRVFQQYETDWNEWPVALGAPYIERNGVPGYQPPPPFSATFTADDLIAGDYDEPGISGADEYIPADQVLWTVFNDLNASTALSFVSSEPLGLEIQKTMWAYKGPAPVANLYFARYKILNKGGVDTSFGGGKLGAFFIDSMYVSQWADPDVGSFSDDFCGCDTVLALAFAYNANDVDATFRNYGLAPPSVGYTYLQGPRIPSVGDSVLTDLLPRQGFRSLPVSSFSPFVTGSPYSDPPNGVAGGYAGTTGQWWKLLRGFAPVGTINDPDQPYVSGPFPVSKFPFSGDPIRRTGFLDGLGTSYSTLAGDRRFVLNSGPFSFAPSDTQEVILSLVVGLGSDRLSSISVMKSVARFARATYNGSFSVPRAPTAPKVNATELNGEVVLEWGSDVQRVKSTEDKIVAGEYRFEGYSVYQLPSSTSKLSEGTRIATFDLKNNVTSIIDYSYDSPTGEPIPVIVQEGTDSGVRRFLDIRQDFLSSAFREPLRNGKEYYFAVTAYNYAPAVTGSPRSYESDPLILSVKPKIPFGIQSPVGNGDSVSVTHTSGNSDGIVSTVIVDPLASTGQTYRVRFDTSASLIRWTLDNTTRGNTILSQQPFDTAGTIVEGGVLLTMQSREGLKPGTWSWTGQRFITWAGGADGLRFEEFNGAVGWSSPYSYFSGGTRPVPGWRLPSIEIRFAPTSDSLGTFSPADPNSSYAYRYGSNFSLPAKPSFLPFIVNPYGGFPYQDFTISMPLAVYDIDANPPRRLAVGFLENNAEGGAVNGKYWPPYYNDADNTNPAGPREWLFIFDSDYTTSPDSTLTKDLLSNPVPVMYWATWARRDNFPWPSGNSMRLTAYKPFSPGDVYSYTLPAVQTGIAVDKESAKRVGVFPNPYYGSRSQETTTWRHFVTFNNLPSQATIRIFNLAGHLVRTLHKDDPSQFLEWDLTNEDRWAVASGMYICYVEMPAIGETKILKLAVIQPQSILTY